MGLRNDTRYIVVHCSATPPTLDIGAGEIEQWHTDPKPLDDGGFRYLGMRYTTAEELPESVRGRDRRGRGWLGIGYHFVIRRGGVIEIGRDVDVQAAHVKGYNDVSVGICLVGGIDELRQPENNFTGPQWVSLRLLADGLLAKYADAVVLGHHDLYRPKACPSFDVMAWHQRQGEFAGVY